MKVVIRMKGGKGSGHHGHSGRPGMVGGSTAGRFGSPQEVMGDVFSRMGDLRGSTDPKISLDDPDAFEGSQAQGKYYYNNYTVALTKETSDRLRNYMDGDRSDEAIAGYQTFVHEVYHSQYGIAFPEDKMLSEGLAEYHARNLVKDEHPDFADPKPHYTSYVDAVRVLESKSPGIANKLFKMTDEKKQVAEVKKVMRNYVKDLLISKGANKDLAEFVASKIKKPDAILRRTDYKSFENPKATLKGLLQTLAAVQEYGVPVDWRKY